MEFTWNNYIFIGNKIYNSNDAEIEELAYDEYEKFEQFANAESFEMRLSMFDSKLWCPEFTYDEIEKLMSRYDNPTDIFYNEDFSVSTLCFTITLDYMNLFDCEFGFQYFYGLMETNIEIINTLDISIVECGGWYVVNIGKLNMIFDNDISEFEKLTPNLMFDDHINPEHYELLKSTCSQKLAYAKNLPNKYFDCCKYNINTLKVLQNINDAQFAFILSVNGYTLPPLLYPKFTDICAINCTADELWRAFQLTPMARKLPSLLINKKLTNYHFCF